MKVEANGQTFEFPDGTTNDQIGQALDEYFSGQQPQQPSAPQESRKPTQQEIDAERSRMYDEMGAAEKVAVQLGRGFDRFGTGVAQLAADLIPGDQGEESLTQRATDNREMGRVLSEKPGGVVLPLVAELAPGLIAGGVASAGIKAAAAKAAPALAGAVSNAGAAGRVAKGAGIGAGFGSIAPVAEGDSRAENMAMGAAFGAGGAGLGEVASRAVTPLSKSAGAVNKTIRAELDRLGLRVPPAKLADSKGLSILEASGKSSPLTAGAFNAADKNNVRVISKLAADEIGEKGATKLTPEVLDRAYERVGNVFKSVRAVKEIPIKPQFLAKLGDIKSKYSHSNIPSLQNSSIEPILDDMAKLAANGKMTGSEYHSIASRLSSMAKTQATSAAGDRDAAIALMSIKDALDDVAEDALSGAQREAFKKARYQYMRLMQLKSANAIDASGDIKISALRNHLTRKDYKGMMRGHDNTDLIKALRYLGQFGDTFGNSGTAERLSMYTTAGGGLGLSALGAAVGGPIGAAVAPVATGVALNAGSRAYLSPMASRYITNEMLGSAGRNAITAPSSGIAALLAQQSR